MTFRQQEFARHYAQGKPATKAALAAGYTQSTAETNAARLLRSPDIINEIRRQRNGLRIVTIDDIMRTMTRLMHIIDNAENPAHVLQATAQLLRYLRFQPDVWPEYPDKTDKKSDIAPDLDDDSLFEGSSPRTQTTGPLGPSEPQMPQPERLDNPDKNPDTRTESLLGDSSDEPMMQSWENRPSGTPDNPDKNPDQSTLKYPALTPEFLESIEDYTLADLVRQNPIMGKILAHKYANRPDEPEPAYA